MLKKINLGLVALVLGFGLFFTTSAFTAKTTTNWAYQPDEDNNMLDYTKYFHTNTPSSECGSGSLPCLIAVPEEVTSPEDLQEYFLGKETGDIIDISSGRTPLQ